MGHDVFPDRLEESWHSSEQRLEIGRLNFGLAEERARNATLRTRLADAEAERDAARGALRALFQPVGHRQRILWSTDADAHDAARALVEGWGDA